MPWNIRAMARKKSGSPSSGCSQHCIETSAADVAPAPRKRHAARHQICHGAVKIGIPRGQALLELFGRRGRRGRLGLAGLQLGHQGMLQGVQALAVFGAQGHNRLSQGFAEGRGVDAHPEACGLIGHVEGQDGRKPQLLHLQRQAQLPVELTGIEHHQHQIHRRVLKEATHHGFVVAEAAQVVDARQIDQLKRMPRQLQVGLHQVHRETWPVADVRVMAGEPVEQGQLAGVGHAENGNAAHAARLTRAASRRRSISSVMPTRTCSGPDHQPRRSTCTTCPGRRPSASRRCRRP
jgi:hypothetical protein